MTVAEFLDWDPRDAHGRRWQLIDGVPVAMAPAADRHGSIQSELGGICATISLPSTGLAGS